MLASVFLFAQEKATTSPPEMSNPLITMAPLILIFVGMYFFIIMPAQRREKKQREAIFSNLKKNDEVLTTSGIIGTVQNLREGEDEVTIKIDDNCKVRMKKTSIVQILKAKDAAETAAPAAK